MALMRVQKFLSRAGVASRRASEDLMLEGRVRINGEVCKQLGTKVDPASDRVEVDGDEVHLPEQFIYILLNKPQNYITTLDDPHDRPIVTDLLPENMPRIWPVGRLDWDSEGAILMTNDGNLTHKLTHPSHEIEKTYAVKVQGIIDNDAKELEQMREGVEIEPGVVTKPAIVKVGRDTGKNTWLEFRIHEGRNRQIRKMCEAVGFRVSRLRRLAIGPLSISGVSSGEFRALTSEEVYDLYDALGEKMPTRAKPTKRQLKKERNDRKHGRLKKTRSVSSKKKS